MGRFVKQANKTIAMEIKENNAGLGKNHDEDAREHDIAKKQSEAKPAAENLDMMPHSKNSEGDQEFLATEERKKPKLKNVHEDAADYAKEEHKKAANWENSETDTNKSRS